MQAIRNGGPGLSLDDLAAGAGVSKPVLYEEFGGRVGVADAVAVQLAGQVERASARAIGQAEATTASSVVDAIIDAFLDLIDNEPELYQFVVRTMRDDGRGLLDNALVRVLHDRTAPIISALAPSIDRDRLAVLTDGVYGFVLAALESWQSTKALSREDMVALLSGVIRQGLASAL